MTLTEAAAILKQHNEWRRWDGDDPRMVDPEQLGIAIDLVVAHIEQTETGKCPVTSSK